MSEPTRPRHMQMATPAIPQPSSCLEVCVSVLFLYLVEFILNFSI